MSTKYALITGGTGGLGSAFAELLAQEGYALLLTGRSEEKLVALKGRLEKEFPQAEIKIYAADLANSDSRERLMKEIQAEGILLSLLVNAAGADIQKGLTAYTQEKISFQCRVNFEAAVALSLFAIQNKAEHLDVLNISSVSGIYPMPYFAIYSATKGALTSFSQALREEMKGKEVFVTAVLPGAMPTREDIKEQIQGQGLWGKLAAMSPKEVAARSLKGVRKNKRKVIVGFWNKVMRIFTCWIPVAWLMKFIANRWGNISKDAF